MLTIKQITENTEAVIRGLEKKHFKNAKETIAQVLDNIETHASDKGFTKAVSIPKSYLPTALPLIIRSGNRIAIHDFKTNNDVRQQQSE